MQDRSARYTLLEKLGTGSFGTVWKALSKDSGGIVAIKQIDLESSDDDIAEIQLEITHLAACDSRHVTGYYESFITGFRLWIVMEYMTGGSALDLMKTRPFTEAQAAVVCREVLEGLAYLHSHGKLHRDIKAANVLLSNTGQVKLADFGVAAQLSSNMSRRHTFVGTPFWMAPEVIKQAGYNHKADIWSLGITAMELLLGEPPLSDFHPMRVIFLIPKSPAPVLVGDFTAECKDFVRRCLQKEPQSRASATELLHHPFIEHAGSIDLLQAIEGLAAQRSRDEDILRGTSSASPSTSSSLQSSLQSQTSEDGWEFETIKPRSSLATQAKVLAPLRIEEDVYATIKPRVPPARTATRSAVADPRAHPETVIAAPSDGDSLRDTWPSSHGTHSTLQAALSDLSDVTVGDMVDGVRLLMRELASRDPAYARPGTIEALLHRGDDDDDKDDRYSQRARPKQSPIAELLYLRWANDLLSRVKEDATAARTARHQ